jgi:hypothetical protein
LRESRHAHFRNLIAGAVVRNGRRNGWKYPRNAQISPWVVKASPNAVAWAPLGRTLLQPNSGIRLPSLGAAHMLNFVSRTFFFRLTPPGDVFQSTSGESVFLRRGPSLALILGSV